MTNQQLESTYSVLAKPNQHEAEAFKWYENFSREELESNESVPEGAAIIEAHHE